MAQLKPLMSALLLLPTITEVSTQPLHVDEGENGGWISIGDAAERVCWRETDVFSGYVL